MKMKIFILSLLILFFSSEVLAQNSFVTPSSGQTAVEFRSATSASTATLSRINSSATSVTIIASNTLRKGLTLINDSTQIAYVAFAASATSTSYTLRMVPHSTWILQTPIFTGAISAIWVSANGAMVVSEL